jgi:hypothetical protein
MMQLSHEALARLVDRVAALRAMSEKEREGLHELRDTRERDRNADVVRRAGERRDTLTSAEGADADAGVWSEDDEVEALARQIAAIDRQ